MDSLKDFKLFYEAEYEWDSTSARTVRPSISKWDIFTISNGRLR